VPGLVFDGEEDLGATETLIEDVIPEEGAGMLFGESDVGKTTVAINMSVHVAGASRGHGKSVRHGTVLFVEAEGGRAFSLRKHAAKGAAGIDEGVKLPFITVYDTSLRPRLGRRGGGEQRRRDARSVAERGLPPIRLVVADTLARTSPRGCRQQPRDVGFPPNLPCVREGVSKGRSLDF